MNPTNSPFKINSFLPAFIIFLTVISFNAKAQLANSSPYSRYGLGDLPGKGFSQGFAMGGTNIAMQNDSTALFFINSGNPASYSNINLTTAELGINLGSLKLQNSSSTSRINTGSVGYVSLAFPIKKWWGASIGILPYSTVGYNVSEHQSVANIGELDFLYEGNGGINQAYFGNGIKPLYGLTKMFINSKKYQRLKLEKNDSLIARIIKRKDSWKTLSFGLNASYMFGSINHIQRSVFPSSSNSFNTRTGTSMRVGDVYFDYGVQYAYTFDTTKGRSLREPIKLILGATLSTQSDINARIDSLSYTYYNSSTGYEVVRDTIKNTEGTKGVISIPLSFGFGIGFKKGDKWLISSDLAIQNWSNYSAFNTSPGLKNTLRISAGAQYIPNSKASGKGAYYKRINYRIGLRYGKTAIELKNHQLTENAISFGFGFPVSRIIVLQNFSMINLGLEIGQRGTLAEGLIKEQFIKALIGFTINDKWFIKPKFD